MVNKMLGVVKNIGLKSAKGAVNSASTWLLYQPIEPELIKERLRKQREQRKLVLRKDDHKYD